MLRQILLKFRQDRYKHWRKSARLFWKLLSVFLGEQHWGKGVFFLFLFIKLYLTYQFNSVTQSCPTLCDPMDWSTQGLPDHYQFPKLVQTHVHRVSDAIQPSHNLLSPSPPASDPSQHQGLFQWVTSSYQVAKVLEFQLQLQSFQWIVKTDFL